MLPTWLWRLFAALAVALLGPLVAGGPASAFPSHHADTCAAYAFDQPDGSDILAGATAERGPPTTYGWDSTPVADHQWSSGPSAHSDGPVPPAAIDYDHPDMPVQLARPTPTTGTSSFVSHCSRVAAKAATGAESALSGALLKTHLRQLEKYGAGGFRELESGRFRYYGELSPTSKSGDMVGRRLVREWDPASGATRTWHETIDRSGSVRIVRPETGGPKTHYFFDEFGGFGGSW